MDQGQALLDALGEWEGFEVTGVERREGNPDEIHVSLRPREGAPLYCNCCGRECTHVHEHVQRTVRDLPLFDAITYLEITIYRVWCEHCGGPKRMRIDWLADQQRVTNRLAESVIYLCSQLSIQHVARFYRLHWHTVKRIDKRALKARLDPADFSDVRVIGMDEFALHKGHRYATVVVDPIRKRVLWVGPGRDRAAVRKFFEQLGPEQCERIEAAVMDMHPAFTLEVQKHCPNARIVYDLFHVIAKYSREVVDRVRVDQANALRHDKAARKVVKASKWLLLRSPRNTNRAQRVRLQELFDANTPLMIAYMLREDLKALWSHRDPVEAKGFWEDWYQRAMESGVAAIQRFAERIKAFVPGILAHAEYPLHTSLIEGINNKIKVIKRMAYGFRDDEYFFLKIRAAYPGNAR